MRTWQPLANVINSDSGARAGLDNRIEDAGFIHISSS